MRAQARPVSVTRPGHCTKAGVVAGEAGGQGSIGQAQTISFQCPATWYDASGNETQYASVDGSETDVLTFPPGAAYATQMNVYENGGLVEVDNWNGTSGALQDVLLYNGGAYPYEVEEASNDGAYFSQIELALFDHHPESIFGNRPFKYIPAISCFLLQ